MDDTKEEVEILSDSNGEVIKEEVELTLFWYLFIFFATYLGSYLIPAIIFVLYLVFIFGPFFLENNNFLALFIEMKSLITLLSIPLVLISCYLIRLFFVALITRGFWRYTEKKSPTKSGIIPRNFPSKTLNYYHIRSYMVKYPKNLFRKGIFPWLANWFYNFVGISKIGKGSTIEDQLGADRFIDVGKNSYIGVGSGISSHFVEGIFGNISYFEIKFGDNVTMGSCNIAPGCEIKDNSYLLPLASATKHNVTKGNNYYFGMPLRRIFKKKIMRFLNLSEYDLDKAEQLRIKQVKLKNDEKSNERGKARNKRKQF